jgi:hypothetical protein
MNKAQAKERLLRWVAIPAMTAVLVGLAVLQYRWSGQVSDATRAQMLASLHTSLMGFRQDFNHELAAAAVEIRTIADTSNADPTELNDQFHRLQQTAAHPNLFHTSISGRIQRTSSHCGLIRPPANLSGPRGRQNLIPCSNACSRSPPRIIRWPQVLKNIKGDAILSLRRDQTWMVTTGKAEELE